MMRTERDTLLKKIAKIIKDYREGEISTRSPERIGDWVSQFPDEHQLRILKSLGYVLSNTYVSKDDFRDFLIDLATSDHLSGTDKPETYWRKSNIMNIQKAGNSQRDLVELFGELLEDKFGFSIEDAGSDRGHFIYLDDCIATGSRLRSDLCEWIQAEAPSNATVNVITPFLYRGSYWAEQEIQKTAFINGKHINLKMWRLEEFDLENRRNHRDRADVLWPARLSDTPAVNEYVEMLKQKGYPPVLRKTGNAGNAELFKNDGQKVFLEMAMLNRGCLIRRRSQNLPERARPLGYHNLDCLGFGSMMVTYRNCPNNTPLPFWVQQSTVPTLFPRKTNSHTAITTH